MDMLTSGGIQVGWGEQWETLANAINDYYGGSVSSVQYQQVVQMLNSGNYTMEEMERILWHIPEFNRTYNAAGKLTSVSYKATAAGNTVAGEVANAVNSNAATATNTQFQTLQTITKDAQTGKVTMSDTVKKYNAGTASTTKAVATSAVAAVAAASVGIKAGKAIDYVLYNLNPDFWDDNGMGAINPETWGSITAGENSGGAKLFNFVFDIDPQTNNPQAYIDENTFAYMVAYMMSRGVFDGNGGVEPPANIEELRPEGNEWVLTNPLIATNTIINTDSDTWHYSFMMSSAIWGFCTRKDEHSFCLVFCSKYPNQSATYTINGGSPSSIPLNLSTTFNNETIYYSTWNATGQYNQTVSVGNVLSQGTWSGSTSDENLAWLMYAILFGTPITGVEGITDQDGEPQFDTTGLNDPSDIAAILAALMTQFPELWDNRIEVSPDGDTIIKYIPVGFPTGGEGQQPTTNGAVASDLAPDITGGGENATDELIKTIIDMIQNPQEQSGMESDTTTPTEPVDPNANDAGSGVTPPFVIPTGSASALYSVYNPSQAQLNSLGAWLWSSNFVDQLLKLFNDPMQAIIGLHKVFASPSISGAGTIKVGYLDSGVGSNLVGSQYTEIDCGTVKLDEYFKNALDYTKTDVYIYLPFVGIVPLNVEDVTRANINVKYKVDVLTGACLASVNVTRDAGGGGQLYVYAGNCAVQYPLSSGSYMGIVASALGIAGSIAGTVLSGGAMLPVALGVGASALGGARTKVEHSGSLSGNSGAMGIKKPYLIIRRPQTKIATTYPLLAGGSNNTYGVLSSFTGHVRIKYVHIENIAATSDELNEIESLLKSGVMI